MKQLFLFVSYLMITVGVHAQAALQKGSANGHEWVDLGLSVKWATCNVGANRPEDYGGYYAWGETRTKSNYTWGNCFDCVNISKWNVYKIGGKTKLEPNSGHDTARENWGGTWRMPTKAELDELCVECTWKWTSKGGRNGYEVIGPNGNSIFLPAAGTRYDTSFGSVGEYGYYWSSTLDSRTSSIARSLYFYSSSHYTYNYNRRWDGLSVRPVMDFENRSGASRNNVAATTNTISTQNTQSRHGNLINGHEYVDLGLSVKWATCNVGANRPEDYGGYYAWGETKTKTRYDWDNCFDCLDKTGDKWGIYKIGGKTKITPDSRRDAARENWGGTWRMPTIKELEELNSKCTWKWTTKGGHNGYVVTGPNGNMIFLPAAGYRSGTSSDYVGEGGYYWSSTLSSSRSYNAQRLLFNSGYHDTGSYGRRGGFSVRPVTE